jgi:hypothetical protein
MLWGADFQLFRINSLEVVDRIFSSWNPLINWLRRIEGLKEIA